MIPSTAVKVVAGELTGDELVEVLVQGESDQAAFKAWWFAALAEFDRRELWGHEGARSCAEWLARHCGLDGRTAREYVSVMRRLQALRRIRGAFAEGRVSYSQVRALCRVATVEAEEFLLGLALSMSASDLERSLRAYAAAHGEPLTLEADEQRRARAGIERSVEPDGMVRYVLTVPPEEALVIDKGIDFGRDEQWRERKAAASAGEPPPRRTGGRQGRIEGLLWTIRNGLVNTARGIDVDDPYVIVIPVEEGSALLRDDGDIDLGNGLTVHPRTLRRLCCSSMIQVMLHGDQGERPLDLGRSARVANRAQRRASRVKYKTCQFPAGCDVPSEYCRLHHIAWWGRDEGPTDLANLVPLCGRHHHLVHEGGWELTVGADGALVLLGPDGRRREAKAALADRWSNRFALRRQLRAMGVEVDGGDFVGSWGGEPMTRFARDVIVGAIADALEGPAPPASAPAGAAATSGGVVVDAALARGAPPSLN